MSTGDETLDDLVAGGDLGAVAAAEVSTRIGGRYRVIGLLGRGGMGAVYAVHDEHLDVVVALKWLSAHSDIAALRREVNLARQVTHPGIVRIYDIGEDGGDWFLTMERVVGPSLTAHLEAVGRPSTQQAIDWIAALCDAVQVAHDVGVVHRDLKPDNVLVRGSDGTLVVTDFGIAGATAGSATVAGTPAYLAPEQLDPDRPVDPRTDQYALGVMFYELLSGARPFSATTLDMARQARATIVPPSLDDAWGEADPTLTALVSRMMARNPAHRWPSLGVLADKLRELVLEVPAFPQAPASVRAPLRGARSVTVLSLTATEADAWLSEGVTEVITDLLAQAPSLVVHPFDPNRAAASVVTDAVVTGSMRRFGDGIRIAARVVERGTQVVLGSTSAVTTEALVLDAANQVATEIAGMLAAQISPAEASGSPEVQEGYLRSRKRMRDLWQGDLRPALVPLGEVLRLDPNHVGALATWARIRARQGFQARDPAPLLAEAESSARAALAINQRSAEAWLALAEAAFYGSNPAAALEAADRSIALQPSRHRGHEIRGMVLCEANRVDLAERALLLASDLPPARIGARLALVRIWAARGDWKRVESGYDVDIPRFEDLFPQLMLQIRLAAWYRLPLPESVLHQLHSGSSNPLGAAAYEGAEMFATLARGEVPTHGSFAVTAQIMRHPGSNRLAVLTGQNLVELLAGAGQVVAALDNLEITLGLGLRDLHWLEICPLLDKLRAEPRFHAVRDELVARARPVWAALGETH